MNTGLHRRVAVAVLLAVLLPSVEVEAVAAQGAFRRIKRGAKRVTRTRDVVNTARDAVSPSSRGVDTSVEETPSAPVASYGSEDVDRQIAATFAPVFYQGLGSRPRYDYITNFDFDRDWRGDNNWANAGNAHFPLLAYIYYSVAETPTHYFITYAVFHPRDYKGGKRRGPVLSQAIEAGVSALGRFDPTGRAAEATLAHENDLEGCLVVAEKRGSRVQDARVQFVETLAHNRFLKYMPRAVAPPDGVARIRLTGQHAELYIEPRGHGIRSRQPGRERKRAKDVLIYNYTGQAGNPSKRRGNSVGYALAPLQTTLWARALPGKNQTYAEAHEYTELLAALTANRGAGSEPGNARGMTSGEIGSAFRGSVGGTNMARAPWGWFDGTERDRPLGEWFFDPAGTIKRHFKLGESFSTTYTHTPALGITR